MASIGDYTSGNYLAASDLKGKPRVAQITEVEFTEFEDDGRKKVKPVVTFENISKPLILNKTNAKAIAELLDDETDDWIGEKICIYPTIVAFGNKDVDAVRVRAVPSKKKGKSVNPQRDDDLDDEIPDLS